MKLIPLGISSGVPTRDRHVASHAVVLDGRWVLFDCGEGTQQQIMNSGLKSGRLEAIFITHLHGDHVFGLPGFLSTLSLQGHDQTGMKIYGPMGLKNYLHHILESTFTFLSFPVEVIEIKEGEIKSTDFYSVNCLSLDHVIPSFGYSLHEKDSPGTFDMEKFKKLGIPEGPICGELRQGKKVQLSDGRIIDGSDYVGPLKKGKKFAYCSDTRPCENSVILSQNANALLHEATYNSEFNREAQERGHSTAREAATIGKKANVEKLILTHFSPRYKGTDLLLAEAREIFQNTVAATELEEISI